MHSDNVSGQDIKLSNCHMILLYLLVTFYNVMRTKEIIQYPHTHVQVVFCPVQPLRNRAHHLYPQPSVYR